MKVYLGNLWEYLRTSFWFVPTFMMLLSTLLAVGTIWFDLSFHFSRRQLPFWLISANAENAEVLISTIASSMITVAGVVFSMTMVVLSLASSQLGPRLLRNFIRDPVTQVGLGIFTSTFLYCLLVLAWLLALADTGVHLRLSLTMAILLAFASLLMLIRYIHHVSVFIQADTLIQAVSDELCSAIDRLYPDTYDQETSAPIAPHDNEHPGQSLMIPALTSGYVQAIDLDGLFHFADEQDASLQLYCQPGQFVIEKAQLATYWHQKPPEEEIDTQLNRYFIIGDKATPEQDIVFSIRQLEEVALRALSPGINDPGTAIACVDRLTIALGILLHRHFTSSHRFNDDGLLRLTSKPISFENIADAALNQIRQHSQANVAVTACILRNLAMLARQAVRSTDKQAIEKHAILAANGCLEHINEPVDRERIDQSLSEVKSALYQSHGQDLHSG